MCIGQIATFALRISSILSFLSLLKRQYLSLKFTTSKSYWERRYRIGRDSGAGSYGKLAVFKSEVLNEFVLQKGIGSVIEFGCGDGNQLSLAKYNRYVGLDVSLVAVRMCIEKFSTDKSKSFFIYDQSCFRDPLGVFKAEMTLSLDVLYHLVEDEVFEGYMKNLFEASTEWVVIYSSDRELPYSGAHVRERCFTKWVKEKMPNWSLVQRIDNKYPVESGNRETSFANFYFFKNDSKT